MSVFALKDAVLDLIKPAEGTSAPAGFLAFSRLLDGLGLFTFETYAQARDRIIVQQAEEMLELSTPVVKLWDGIVAVPLVGTLDSARTQVVMEKLLQTLVDTGSEHAIIDITGVPAVDTQVAQHLLKTVVAARLMGAECIISGIRPQIAQTVVALGHRVRGHRDEGHPGRRPGPRPPADRRGPPGPRRCDEWSGSRSSSSATCCWSRSRSISRTTRPRLLQEDLSERIASDPGARGAHRHLGARDRRQLRRPDALDHRVGLPGPRRRDRRRRNAPGGGHHPGRARPVAGRSPHGAGRGEGHGLLTRARGRLLTTDADAISALFRPRNEHTPTRGVVGSTRCIHADQDVVRVRQAMRASAVKVSLSLVDQTKVVTAASELARNTLIYGGGGTARVELVSDGRRQGVRATFEDEGPGIPGPRPGPEGRLHDRHRSRSRPVGGPSARRRVRHRHRAGPVHPGRGDQMAPLSQETLRSETELVPDRRRDGVGVGPPGGHEAGRAAWASSESRIGDVGIVVSEVSSNLYRHAEQRVASPSRSRCATGCPGCRSWPSTTGRAWPTSRRSPSTAARPRAPSASGSERSPGCRRRST